jgi:hypothetical protein
MNDDEKYIFAVKRFNFYMEKLGFDSLESYSHFYIEIRDFIAKKSKLNVPMLDTYIGRDRDFEFVGDINGDCCYTCNKSSQCNNFGIDIGCDLLCNKHSNI